MKEKYYNNLNGLISLVRSRSSCPGVHPEVSGLRFEEVDEAQEQHVERINGNNKQCGTPISRIRSTLQWMFHV